MSVEGRLRRILRVTHYPISPASVASGVVLRFRPAANNQRSQRLPPLGVVALVLIAACAGTQPAPDDRIACSPVRGETRSISVAPTWLAGEERIYEVTSVLDHGDGVAVSRPGGVIARLHVDEATPGGWTMRWTAVPLAVSLALWQIDAPGVAPVAAAYRWGPDVGRPRLDNAFELGLWLGEVIDSTRWNLPEEARVGFDLTTAHLEAMTATQFDVVFLEPAAMLHAFEGVEVAVADPGTAVRSIATGVGEQATRATVEIADLIDANDCVSLTMRRTFPVGDRADLGVAVETADSISPLHVEQTLLAQYDVGTRRVASVTLTEIFSGAGAEVIKTTRLVDLTP